MTGVCPDWARCVGCGQMFRMFAVENPDHCSLACAERDAAKRSPWLRLGLAAQQRRTAWGSRT